MIRRLFAGWRHPLRIVAMVMAALSLSWGVALTEGILAAQEERMQSLFAAAGATL